MNKTQDCINWLKTKCDVSFLTNAKIEEIVSLVIQWDVDNAIKMAKYHLDQEEKQKKEEAEREDYKEETDENGRLWYRRTHLFYQREESRKLKKGDAILFKSNQGNGFMFVEKFDFKSDFAARCYYMKETYIGNDNQQHIIYGGDMCPGICGFSFATDEYIKQFFEDTKNNRYDDFLFMFKSNITSDWFKERYGKYVEDCEETWETRKSISYAL